MQSQIISSIRKSIITFCFQICLRNLWSMFRACCNQIIMVIRFWPGPHNLFCVIRFVIFALCCVIALGRTSYAAQHITQAGSYASMRVSGLVLSGHGFVSFTLHIKSYLTRSCSGIHPSAPLLLHHVLHLCVLVSQYVRSISTHVVSVHLPLLPPQVATLCLSVELWVGAGQAGHPLVPVHTLGYHSPGPRQQQGLGGGARHDYSITTMIVLRGMLWFSDNRNKNNKLS